MLVEYVCTTAKQYIALGVIHFMTSAPKGEGIQSIVDALWTGGSWVVHAGVDVHSHFQKLKTECML
jgi:hypothetical protein